MSDRSPPSEVRAMREVASRAVRLGASTLPDRPPPARRKWDRSLVTSADLAVHEAVTRFLASETDGMAVVSEEGGHPGRGDTFWLVDPIDGTANYAAGCADYAISVALVLRGLPVVSAVLLPEHGAEYTAAAGLGTFRNGERVSLDGRRRSQPLIGLGLTPCGARLREQRRLVLRLLSSDCLVREPGCISAGVMRVLTGEWDCYLEAGIPMWDSAPGALLVTEAGGVAWDFDGRAYTISAHSLVLCAPGAAAFTATLRLGRGGGAVRSADPAPARGGSGC